MTAPRSLKTYAALLAAACLLFASLPASALTIRNSTDRTVVGSVRLSSTDTPIFQFHLSANEKVRWSRRLHGHDLVLKAVHGADGGVAEKIVTRDLPSPYCNIDIKSGEEGLQLIVED